ncbi:LysR substrate-binding domain-containing protein [Microvirga sp. TS319]|uniref:LysR substrate-binding domain-containing protein n=1 Tax=Microvirga sp. TS319 TaxID=3241165 RepID=UPI003519DE12
MIDFRHIDAFRAVMKSETMVQAAKLTGISQPGISRLIADLERLSELKLFDRSRGRLHPTTEAHVLLEEVERRYAGLQAIREFARSLKDSAASPVRFGTVMSFGIGFAARAIAAFKAEHPQIPISHTTGSSALIADQVTMRTCDLGLVTDNADVSSVSSSVFASMDLICALPSDSPLAKNRIITAAMLRDQAIIAYPREDMIRWGLTNVLEEVGISYSRASVETPYSVNICALVREGAGVGFVHPIAAYDFLGHGVSLRKFERSLPVRTLFVKGIGSPLSAGAERLGEILTKTLASTEKIVASSLMA